VFAVAAAVACGMLVAAVAGFVSDMIVVACDAVMAVDDSSAGGDAWMQLGFD